MVKAVVESVANGMARDMPREARIQAGEAVNGQVVLLHAEKGGKKTIWTLHFDSQDLQPRRYSPAFVQSVKDIASRGEPFEMLILRMDGLSEQELKESERAWKESRRATRPPGSKPPN